MALYHADRFKGMDSDDDEVDNFEWEGPGVGPASGEAVYNFPPLPVEVAASGHVS